MERKKTIFVISIVMIIFVTYLIVNQIVRLYSPSSPVEQVLIKAQQILKRRDIKMMWQLAGRLTHEAYNNNYEYYEKWLKGFMRGQNILGAHNSYYDEWFQHLKPAADGGTFGEPILNANLKNIITTTPNRILIGFKSLQDSPVVYMVKENDEWKFDPMALYRTKVNMDMQVLSEAIKSFYADKGYLPYTLSELAPEYIDKLPLDPFSDKEKNYNYEVLGEKRWKIYSIGIDSTDDFGLVKLDMNISIRGDIIYEYMIE